MSGATCDEVKLALPGVWGIESRGTTLASIGHGSPLVKLRSYGMTELQREVGGVLAEPVTLQQAIQRCTVDIREPRCPRHVASGPLHQPRDVLLFKRRQHLVFRHVICIVHR